MWVYRWVVNSGLRRSVVVWWCGTCHSYSQWRRATGWQCGTRSVDIAERVSSRLLYPEPEQQVYFWIMASAI